MPWIADYLADGAYVTFSGATTGADLIRANTQFYAHRYYKGPRFCVFDLSAVEHLDVNRTDIERVAAQDVVAAAAAIPNLVVAVIAPQPFSFGMARMWELQVGETEWRTKVVHSRPEALKWLTEQGIATDRFGALQR
jgi:hypothetical protein